MNLWQPAEVLRVPCHERQPPNLSGGEDDGVGQFQPHIPPDYGGRVCDMVVNADDLKSSHHVPDQEYVFDWPGQEFDACDHADR